MEKRPLTLIALLMTAAILCFPAFAQDRALPPIPVKVLYLHSANRQKQYHYFGTVQGSQRADLSFRVPGPLLELPIELGKRLKKGDLVGRIDPRDFRTALHQAQSALSQARAKYTQASNDFKRYDELYKKKAISKAQYDSFRTASDVARSAVKTAEANVAAAKNALNDTELRAPFNGVIVARLAENFQVVQAKQPVASLQNLDVIEIVIHLSEEEIATVGVADDAGMPFRLSEKAKIDLEGAINELPGQTFKLQFKEAAVRSNPQTKTYPVTLTMPRPENARILPGMFINITASVDSVESEEGQEEFFVPLSAVAGDMNGNRWVWSVLRDNSIKKIPVTLGVFRGSRIQVLGDLHKGDLVVVEGARTLVEGDMVKVVE
ncbi:MAG: efflux RND transporter periplasmic adaptor subunit [Pyramidobacter sp.]|jgi:multidrug efflux system membrane fusion protein